MKKISIILILVLVYRMQRERIGENGIEFYAQQFPYLSRSHTPV